ncbi:hypothetical protein Pmani_012896 [Petrolisthes manimaculis]|uniref:non-specific serine/threonine protein kinase n=1 Tax=Petrolisthes manimaculis TaxID=1843537 RepID=A0AAE1PX14_9EUCA|nr:hypothetical protein Pmani_012896 [Petrolisthes manimaculis]
MEKLEVIGEVGRGSYGTVWLVRCRGLSNTPHSTPPLVLKCVELKGCGVREVELARQEVAILARMKHPNIVSYKGSFEEGGRLHLLLGYCEGGDLHTRISLQCSSPFPETTVVRWFIQITMALQYLHHHHILHRDLKTHNILLTRCGLVKVGDFGISRVLSSPRDLATTLVGTPYYMSPEQLASRPYNHKSDVWALGCVLFEMANTASSLPCPRLALSHLQGVEGKGRDGWGCFLVSSVVSFAFWSPPSSHDNPATVPSASQVLQLPYIRRHMALFLQDTAGHSQDTLGHTRKGEKTGHRKE